MATELVYDEGRRPRLSPASRSWVLIAAGINLILAQYWTMREYLVVMSRSEVTILLVVTTFLASCSLGYLVAPRRFDRRASALCTLLFAVQLLSPWLLKEAAAFMHRHDLHNVTALLLGFGLLTVAPLTTIVLPHVIGTREEAGEADHGHAVMVCYRLELVGALVGIGAILTLGRVGLPPLLVLYCINAAAILAFIHGRKLILWGGIPLSLAWGWLYGPLDRRAVVDLYKSIGYPPGITLLATRQSLYNRIDVLRAPDGAKFLLLNGGLMFNPRSLEAFNRYLAGLPSALMPGSRVLIVGTGTLSSVYHASRFAASVDSVEIDGQVVEVTKDLFREYNHLDEVRNWTLHVDDAKHFLGATDRRYDLIVIDLVPPYYIQTALLYTREFYELARQRLTPRGVLAIYAGDWFRPNPQPRTSHVSERTIDEVFPEYLVVNSRAGKMAFIYASRNLPFSKQDVRAWVEASGAAGADEIFEPSQVRPFIQDREAASMDNLEIVFEWSASYYRPLADFLRGRR